MNRRYFIKVMGAGATVTLVPSLLSGCSSASLEGWTGPHGEQDPRLLVLSYAILAPNSHNTQPWIVDFKGPTSFDLFVDRGRLLPETDPPGRQIHISQGTFLELLDIAAHQLGFRADITYFPQGEYSNTEIAEKPVASIVLVNDSSVAKDPLFDQILRRRSNRGPFSESTLRFETIGDILAAYDPAQYPQTITADKNQMKRLAALAVKAMEIETSSDSRNAETIAMFRFNRREREEHRDGFGLAQTGMSLPRRMLAENFILSRDKAQRPGSNFPRQAVDLTRAQAETASGFGWITSATNTRMDQVKVGRAYARVDLTASSLGLAIQPMSQLLEEYAEMKALQAEFRSSLKVLENVTVQMFYRLGRARTVEHTPRRRPSDLIKSSNTTP